MQNTTNEFSFILNTSKTGIGVFAVHDIAKGTPLRLFGDTEEIRQLEKTKVPSQFHDHCLDRGETLMCPLDFGAMHIGWYMNHSKQGANATHKNYCWFASRDIKAGEEICIDYNSLEEPKEAEEAYYSE